MNTRLNLTLALASLAAASVFAQDPVVPAPVRITLNNSATNDNETTGAATADGLEVVGGFNEYVPGGIRSAFPTSNDGGQTWTHVTVRPPSAFQATVEGDPMTAYDARTNTIWVGAMAFASNGGIYVARKNPGANTYQPAVMARINGSVDKGWMAAGPRPGNPNTTRLYCTYNQGVIWSDDLGATWTAPISLGSGLGFLPRIGPNGELYATYWNIGTGVDFRRSLDGGQTWSGAIRAATRMDVWSTESPNSRFAGAHRVPPLHSMAVNPVDGTIAIVYPDTTNIVNGNRNVDLYLVRSSNQGTTWSTPQRLPFRDLATIGDMYFPWVEYTKDGRLHLLAFDSQYVQQNDNPSNGFLDQDYAYSDDNGATWGKFRLTAQSFRSDAASPAFLGDYLGMGISDRYVYPIHLSTITGEPEGYTSVIFNPNVFPNNVQLSRGQLVSGNLASILRKDGNRYLANPGITVNNSESPVQIDVTGNSVIAPGSKLELFLWTSGSATGVQQKVQLLNIQTQQYDTVDTRQVTLADSNTVVTVNDPVPYITPGSGTVRMRLAYRASQPVPNNNWEVRVDQAIFRVFP
ncbi:MAG: exo-alpha-sialidase [Fimbriimonadaceae bacterium]|nr:exo-alpha-sialidase [Fimbriimonadaceae bacterium]QYK56289.1 MAG: exo-alpha-sialidase [Fimbriimonadaceae bacterium]